MTMEDTDNKTGKAEVGRALATRTTKHGRCTARTQETRRQHEPLLAEEIQAVPQATVPPPALLHFDAYVDHHSAFSYTPGIHECTTKPGLRHIIRSDWNPGEIANNITSKIPRHARTSDLRQYAFTVCIVLHERRMLKLIRVQEI